MCIGDLAEKIDCKFIKIFCRKEGIGIYTLFEGDGIEFTFNKIWNYTNKKVLHISPYIDQDNKACLCIEIEEFDF